MRGPRFPRGRLLTGILEAGAALCLVSFSAALCHAPIVILDEPTTGLDAENESAVLQALERLTAGRTTFVVTHDLALSAGADLVLYLEEGRVVEQGTPQELARRAGRYAALDDMQAAMRGRRAGAVGARPR